ncbi:NADPH-dependent ferric siderophore reductase [Kineococcus xinjiangensis]|uniref:NADPH-dependent ferric siderophore reductase n=1 Tax=Kineococcus xinjiangensis TaxID=512762 RepID=A0A2S6IUP9_9ACTN|nr:siderophore-interacting protein [Kineococcus xinjiangensis]PPK97909.1 NADPH-dependent ferric siderophore reductase [Kineococcus xinjiangensis]
MSVLAAGAAPVVVTAPRYRPFHLQVVRRQRLSPGFVRITLGGADLADFGAAGWDQRIKVVPPVAGRRWQDAPEDWFGWWRALPEETRPPMRTYTVRAARPAAGEIDVDFVLHDVDTAQAGLQRTGPEHAGPAATWAATATPGDRVVVIGPSAPGTGRMWGVEFAPPPAARSVLLAGDETAVPAISAILEALPQHLHVTALLEVPQAADILPLTTAADARIEWMPRAGSRAPHGRLLTEAVRRHTAGLGATGAQVPVLEDVDVDAGLLWEVPDAPGACGQDGLYAWLAGEAGMVKELRRHLVREVGVPRESVAFMGYWRRGRAEHA